MYLRESRPCEKSLRSSKRTGAHSKHVQRSHIACHQRRSCEAEHLPERKIPGHYCENRTNWRHPLAGSALFIAAEFDAWDVSDVAFRQEAAILPWYFISLICTTGREFVPMQSSLWLTFPTTPRDGTSPRRAEECRRASNPLIDSYALQGCAEQLSHHRYERTSGKAISAWRRGGRGGEV
jgi:hypothetical protein